MSRYTVPQTFNSVRIAVERDGMVALARRAGTVQQAGMFEIFGGKIEPQEDPLEAAQREVYEEFGGEVDFVTALPVECSPYEITEGRLTGSKVKVFGFLAVTSCEDFDLNPDEHEIGSGAWMPPAAILELPDITHATKLAIENLRPLF